MYVVSWISFSLFQGYFPFLAQRVLGTPAAATPNPPIVPHPCIYHSNAPQTIHLSVGLDIHQEYVDDP